MKLAEALQERADLNARIEQLRRRLTGNVLVQEGERPAEDPAALMTEFEECVNRLEYLMDRINLTNCTVTADGKTLTEWIAHRDCLHLKIKVYREMLTEASSTTRRATRSEIRIHSVIDVREKQKAVDELAKELRLTDNRIQSVNWTTDLME